MTDLTNLASRITDFANTINSAEDSIVATLRDMYRAGAVVVAHDDFNERPITIVVYPAGVDTDDIDNAVMTVDLSAGCRDQLDFVLEA